MVKRSKFGDSQLNGELKTKKNHQVSSNSITFSVYSKQRIEIKFDGVGGVMKEGYM